MDEARSAGGQAPGRHRRRAVRTVLVLLVAGAIAGGAAWWLDQGRYLFFPKSWGVVEEGRIWRSGQIHRRIVEDVLAEHGVDVVIDLSPDEPGDPDHEAETAAVRHLGVRKVDVPGLDGRGVGAVDAYLEALRTLAQAHDAGERVLVHCEGGSERTGGVVACWRMLFQGWDGARAWEEYLGYRVRPPKDTVLPDWIREHLPEIAETLHTEGLLDPVPAPLPTFAPPTDGGRGP